MTQRGLRQAQQRRDVQQRLQVGGVGEAHRVCDADQLIGDRIVENGRNDLVIFRIMQIFDGGGDALRDPVDQSGEHVAQVEVGRE